MARELWWDYVCSREIRGLLPPCPSSGPSDLSYQNEFWSRALLVFVHGLKLPWPVHRVFSLQGSQFAARWPRTNVLLHRVFVTGYCLLSFFNEQWKLFCFNYMLLYKRRNRWEELAIIGFFIMLWRNLWKHCIVWKYKFCLFFFFVSWNNKNSFYVD